MDPQDPTTTCAGCGDQLPDDAALPANERTPCPSCGSVNRVIAGAAQATAHMSAHVSAVVLRAWGESLTLFGVLYGVAVTVLGVVIAKAWWWLLALYAVVVLVVLVLALLFYAQPIIAAMRWLIERGKRVPPWPFRGWFKRTNTR